MTKNRREGTDVPHEHPILFSGPMVLKLLAGKKTNTRRVLKKAFAGDGWSKGVHHARESGWIAWWGVGEAGPKLAEFTKKAYDHGFSCPYGEPGDRLWVRETWGRWDADHVFRGIPFYYAADTERGSDGDAARTTYGYRYKPSIHMPREACRLTLEVTSVRAERLQNISDADIEAEGIPLIGNYRAAWRELWDSINGKTPEYTWAANPWVWAIGFKVI